MANSERGYEPAADNLRGFDLSMDMDTIDEPSRLPLLVVIALVVLAAFAGVVWLAYTQGVERGRATVSRELIAREVWKIRKTSVPPYTGLKIYEPAGAVERNSTMTGARKQTAANAAIPALRPSATAAPDNAPAVSAKTTQPAKAAVLLPTGAAAPPKAIALQPGKVVATSQPQTIATRGPTELSKPAAAPSMPSHPITTLESPSTNPAPAPAAAPPATVAPASAAPSPLKGVVLQIGSYKSEAEARQSWNAFKGAHGAAAGYRPDVRAAHLGARGTWYRLRMGPFADKKSAMEVCGKLKADGASCLLAR